MARTRRQEVALHEQGVPTTPPQQMTTPKRAPRKPKEPLAPATNITLPPKPEQHEQQPKPVLLHTRVTRQQSEEPVKTAARPVRTKKIPASQKEAPKPKPSTSGVRKQKGQGTAKSKKASQRIEEAAVISEQAADPKVVVEHLEDTSGQASQLAPSETLFSFPIPPFSSPQRQTTPSIGTIQLFDKNKIKPNTKVQSETSAPSSTEYGNALPPDPSLEPQLLEIIVKAIPNLIALLRNHPQIKDNAALESLLMERGISVQIRPVEKSDAGHVSQLEQQTPHAPEHAPETPDKALQIGSRNLLKRKISEGEQDDILNVAPKRPRTGTAPKTKRVPQLFDANGMLTLTAYKEVPVDEEESSGHESSSSSSRRSRLRRSSAQTQQQRRRSPQTPQSRGWGLSGFLASAQAASRYLPSFSRRTPVATPVPFTPSAHTTDLSQVQNDENTSPTPSTRVTDLQAQNDERTFQTPSARATDLQTQNDEYTSQSEPYHASSDKSEASESSGSRPGFRRHRHPKSKRAKMEKDEIRKRDLLIASLQAQLEANEEDRALKDNLTKSAAQAEDATLAKNSTLAEKSTLSHEMTSTSARPEGVTETHTSSPGTADEITVQMPKSILKRKRMSPTVITNPPSGAFSVVLDYDSDSDDENVPTEGKQASPSGKPTKKIRFSDNVGPLYIGDRFSATPYLGKELAMPSAPFNATDPRNTFLDKNVDTNGPVSPETPLIGPTVTIRVPSPGDSDSEWDGSYFDPSDNPPVTSPSPKSASAVVDKDVQSSIFKAAETASLQGPAPSVNSNINPLFDFYGSSSRPKTSMEIAFPNTWNPPMPPPLPQAPSIAQAPNPALDKARQSALKHKPQQPSRLRETSRFSTSKIGSDVNNDDASDSAEDSAPKADESRQGSTKTLPKPSGRDQQKQIYIESSQPSIMKDTTFDDEDVVEDSEDRNPYAGQTMRQSPRDSMLLEPVPQPRQSLHVIDHSPGLSTEISTDSSTSEEDMSDDLPVFDGYAKFQSHLNLHVNEDVDRELSSHGMSKEVKAAPLEPRVETNDSFSDRFEGFYQSQTFSDQFEEFLGSQTERSGQDGTLFIPKFVLTETKSVPDNVQKNLLSGWEIADDGLAVDKFDVGFDKFFK